MVKVEHGGVGEVFIFTPATAIFQVFDRALHLQGLVEVARLLPVSLLV